MKLLRISGSVIALTAISLLAACGGGGGGGSTPPTSNPTTAPPGGGGPPPTTPTPSPTGSTSPTPSPTHSPATPTPAPTQTPISTPTPSGSVPVNTGLMLNATENFGPNGSLWYNSGTASWANTAGYDSSSQAPTTTGATFEGMTCADTIEGASFPSTAYSQHMFVGIYNSAGTEEALPQALGMVQPVAPTAGTPTHPNNFQEVEQYQCEYNVHTHDYSGLVHIEDVGQPQTESYTASLSYASLQTLLDLWGATLNTATGLTAGANSLNGAVTIYTGMPTSKNGNNDLVNSYTQFMGSPSTLMLSRHEVVWIVIGTTPANIPTTGPNQNNGLPEVQFGEKN